VEPEGFQNCGSPGNKAFGGVIQSFETLTVLREQPFQRPVGFAQECV